MQHGLITLACSCVLVDQGLLHMIQSSTACCPPTCTERLAQPLAADQTLLPTAIPIRAQPQGARMPDTFAMRSPERHC